MRIQNNVPALNAHRFYTINNNGMTKSIAKLSSGYRINSAADDAAGLAISEKMRAQIRGLTMASKNAQDAVSLIQTAEGGMQEIDNMLQRIRELVDYAANDTQEQNPYGTGDRQKIQNEISQLTQEIDSMADRVEFNKKKLLNGEVAGLTRDSATLTAAVNLAKDNLKDDQAAYSKALQAFKNAADGAQANRDAFYTALTNPNISSYLSAISDLGGSVAEQVDAVKDALGVLKGEMDKADNSVKVNNLDDALTDVRDAVTALGTALDASTDAVNKTNAKKVFDNLADLIGKADRSDALTVAYSGGTAISSAGNAHLYTDLSKAIKDILVSEDGLGISETIKGLLDSVGDILKEFDTGSGIISSTDYADSYAFINASGWGTLTTQLNTLKSAYDAVKQAEGDSKTLAQYATAVDALNTAWGNIGTTLTGLSTLASDALAESLTAGGGGSLSTALVNFVEEGKQALSDLITTTLGSSGDLGAAITAIVAGKGSGGAVFDAATALDPGNEMSVTMGQIKAGSLDGAAAAPSASGSKGLTGAYEAYNAANDDLATKLGALNTAKSTLANAQSALNSAPKSEGLYFQVGANANQGVNLYINSIKSDKLGIGDGNGVATINVLVASGTDITAQLDTLDTALSYVTTERAKLGAAQNRMEYTMSSLDISAENLTAAESRIRDVDMAKEMSNFTRQNILFQASTAMLAQANSMPQGVLQLLG